MCEERVGRRRGGGRTKKEEWKGDRRREEKRRVRRGEEESQCWGEGGGRIRCSFATVDAHWSDLPPVHHPGEPSAVH